MISSCSKNWSHCSKNWSNGRVILTFSFPGNVIFLEKLDFKLYPISLSTIWFVLNEN